MQVTKNSSQTEAFNHLSILQIGFGRLGKPLHRHLKSFFNKITLVQNQKEFSKIPEKKFDFAFLSIPDEALRETIKVVPEETKVVHFSGFSYFPHALGLHPVMSFGEESDADFKKITYVADAPLPEPLHYVFKRTLYIKPEFKKIYHTYLSVTANCIQLLTHLLGQNFEDSTQLPDELLKSLVQVSLEEEKKWGAQSFSGPWVRGENQKQNEEVQKINDPVLLALNSCFLTAIKEFKNEHS